jgi:hypothetical protein
MPRFLRCLSLRPGHQFVGQFCPLDPWLLKLPAAGPCQSSVPNCCLVFLERIQTQKCWRVSEGLPASGIHLHKIETIKTSNLSLPLLLKPLFTNDVSLLKLKFARELVIEFFDCGLGDLTDVSKQLGANPLQRIVPDNRLSDPKTWVIPDKNF